jgi:hypothetical protein
MASLSCDRLPLLRQVHLETPIFDKPDEGSPFTGSGEGQRISAKDGHHFNVTLHAIPSPVHVILEARILEKERFGKIATLRLVDKVGKRVGPVNIVPDIL